MTMELPPYGTLERGAPLPVSLGLYPLEDMMFILPVAVTIFIGRLLMKKFLLKPLINFLHISKKNKKKLSDNIWLLLYRLFVIAVGVYLLFTLEWVSFSFDFSSFSSAIQSFQPHVEIFGNMVSQIYDSEKYPIFRYFYLFQIAFYAQSFFSVLFVRRKGKEFLQLAIHYFTTLMLLIYSLGMYGHRVGFIICIMNDFVDVFLRIAKCANEIGWTFWANIAFILFAVVSTLFRIIIFPLLILYIFYNPWENEWISTEGSSVYWIKKDTSIFPISLRFDCIGIFGVCFGPYRLLPLLLVVILFNQVMWYFLTLKLIFEQIILGKKTKKVKPE